MKNTYKIGDKFKHKNLGEAIHTIKDLHGSVATIKLAKECEHYIKNPTKMLIDIAIVNINNLKQVK